jgi:hypothetical protein
VFPSLAFGLVVVLIIKQVLMFSVRANKPAA